jgi:alpha/beta superfamily hydrolase
VVIPLGEAGLALEGTYLSGSQNDDRGALVAPPHPLYGGSMDSPVANEVAYACERCGIASLRFNWRGVGASAGTPSGEMAHAEEDYDAALAHLEQTVSGAIVACGYSFGAIAALRCGKRRPRVRRLALVAPPLAALDRAALEEFNGRLLVIAAEQDDLAPPAGLESALAEIDRAELVVVPEADHFFTAGLARVGRAIRDWLMREQSA